MKRLVNPEKFTLQIVHLNKKTHMPMIQYNNLDYIYTHIQ